MDQSEWIVRRNMRNFTALINRAEDSDQKRVVNGLLREEKCKLVPHAVGTNSNTPADTVNQG